MKNWTRTTHNFNNETREWEYRGDSEKIPLSLEIPTRSALGVHALCSGRWCSLDEIVKENDSYCNSYPESYRATELEILHDLEEMEKLGLVKSKNS